MTCNNLNYEYKFENAYNNHNMSKKGETLSLSELGGFRINPDIAFTVKRNENGVFINCDELDLHAFGRNLEEAKKDLVVEMKIAWDNYVNGDPNVLNDKAIEYGKAISQHVSRM